MPVATGGLETLALVRSICEPWIVFASPCLSVHDAVNPCDVAAAALLANPTTSVATTPLTQLDGTHPSIDVPQRLVERLPSWRLDRRGTGWAFRVEMTGVAAGQGTQMGRAMRRRHGPALAALLVAILAILAAATTTAPAPDAHASVPTPGAITIEGTYVVAAAEGPTVDADFEYLRVANTYYTLHNVTSGVANLNAHVRVTGTLSGSTIDVSTRSATHRH